MQYFFKNQDMKNPHEQSTKFLHKARIWPWFARLSLTHLSLMLVPCTCVHLHVFVHICTCRWVSMGVNTHMLACFCALVCVNCVCMSASTYAFAGRCAWMCACAWLSAQRDCRKIPSEHWPYFLPGSRIQVFATLCICPDFLPLVCVILRPEWKPESHFRYGKKDIGQWCLLGEAHREERKGRILEFTDHQELLTFTEHFTWARDPAECFQCIMSCSWSTAVSRAGERC